MKIRTITVLMLVMAIYFIMAISTEIIIDDFIKPHSVFTYLLITTLITGLAATIINIDIPQ
jgi:hypothetical protein